ncbi:MAG: hypothetical protein KBD66_04275 [Candidatus Doudnabacteria bacterium]|nr:hypothetical protein [Candidatus Doudnabacteria bacterium]
MSEIVERLKGKKVLILYTAHTSGHARIAENIGYWLQQGGADVVLREVLKSNPSPLVKNFLRLHVWVNVHVPQVWSFLYRYGFWVVMMPWRLLAAWFNRGEIQKVVHEVQPALIITTQTSPSAVVNVLKWSGVYSGQWGIAFSDYHFHRAWLYPRADFYLTNIPEQAGHVLKHGVDKKNIFQIGFALPPRATVDVQAVRARLKVDDHARVILVGSGSLGVRMPEELFVACEKVVARCAEEGVACRVIVACGRNGALLCELEERVVRGASWLLPLGYYNPMAELYAVADIFVTKPGGLSIVEATQWGLPIIVTHTLPGQEDLNATYLNKHGLITDLTQIDEALWPEMLKSLLERDVVLNQQMSESVRSCGSVLGWWISGRL